MVVTQHELPPKKTFPTALLWVAIGLLYLYAFFRNRESMDLFAPEKRFVVGEICLVTVLQFFVFGGVLARAFSSQNRITLVDGTKAALVGLVGNYLPLSVGLFTRGIFLKKTQEIAYSNYAGTMVCLYALSVSMSGAFGAVTATFLKVSPFVTLAFILVSASALLIYLPTNFEAVPGVGPFIRDAIKSRQSFKKALIPLGLLTAVVLVMQGFVVQLCFRTVGIELSLVAALFVNSTSVLVRIFSFAPAGIGVKEIFVAALAMVIGVDPESAVLAIGIERITTIASSAMLWPVLFGLKKPWIQ